uniref:GLOBIN domain-containing protein n=1 Tax=Elaeophora elaphi TaxID=1147741 RepID=A0A0R3RM84_9BILA
MLCPCFCSKSGTNNSYDAAVTPIVREQQNSALKDDDTRIPLTQKQKYVLTKNWKGIDREVSAAGVEMFLKMLSLHPEYYKMFPFHGIATSTEEKQRMDECLRAHGESVMKFIGQVISDYFSNIGNAEKFFELINQNGRQHAHKKFFKPELFWVMEEPFLYSVKLILGERYTDNMHSIYKKVIAIILSELEKGCASELSGRQMIDE